MMQFMVHGTFRRHDQQAIVERIPRERERIQALMQQGVLEALYIASDFSGVWLVMKGGIAGPGTTEPGIPPALSLYGANADAIIQDVGSAYVSLLYHVSS